jgi:hypothetical protein
MWATGLLARVATRAGKAILRRVPEAWDAGLWSARPQVAGSLCKRSHGLCYT